MIPIFPRFALFPSILDEHFLLKDLKFYEFTQLTNIEVQQARLDACERKCQEGTLRQASLVNLIKCKENVLGHK